MGKWNKPPPEISQQFLQNEERRKQMIIQAAKRRKQKQRKLQQQVDVQKKHQQQALTKHKQQKKDAYVKYLRNNLHDKYEEIKMKEKQSHAQPRSKSKWKKDPMEGGSQVKSEKNLQGLDLEVNMDRRKRNIGGGNNNKVSNKPGGQVIRNEPIRRNINNNNNNKQQKQQKQPIWQKQVPIIGTNRTASRQLQPQSQKRRMLQDQFQNMWKQQHQNQPNNNQQQQQIDYQLSVQQTVFEDMMGSKLLDSLDLDLDTVTRGKNIDKKLKKQSTMQNNTNKEIDEIKNLIGYESVLMSIDQRSQMIKKYHEFMRNEVPPKEDNQSIEIQGGNFNKEKQNSNNNKTNTNNLSNKNIKMTKQSSQTAKNTISNTDKPFNQGEVFNQLKNKKQGKILNWAQGQAQQAEDLFSNCSTNKKSRVRASQLLKEINKEIQQKNKKDDNKITGVVQNTGGLSQQINMKKKQKPLEIIQQKKMKSSLQKIRQRSYDKKTSIISNHQQQQNIEKKQQEQTPKNRFSRQKVTQATNSRPNRLNSAQQRNMQQPPQPPLRNISRERANKTATNSFKSNSNIQENTGNPKNRNESRRQLSKQKENPTWSSSKQINSNNFVGTGYSKGINKTSSEILPGRQAPPLPQNTSQTRKLPHLPPQQKPIPNIDAITIATQQQVFEVQSFIKNELLSLNRQQRQLQEQLKNIHIENKQKIKEVQKKYDIKTDYKHSRQLRLKEDEEIEDDVESVELYQRMHKRQSEDELEESIQRLDDMLMRREIVNKQKQSRITEQDNESQSTHRSLINPMSDPISLHKQVLQLAENLSRFEGEPEDITTGYGAKLRMKKANIQEKSQSLKPSITSNMKKPSHNNPFRKQTQIDLSQSQDVNYSQLNAQKQSKVSSYRISRVSKPPSLQYDIYNCNIPSGYGESGILDDDGLDDSIEKGKIQVNERLKKMLLD